MPTTQTSVPIAPAKFAHVVRRTTPERYKQVVDWYLTVLGGTVVHGDDFGTFMTYDDEHHRVAVVAVPGLADAPELAVGTDHIAFTYETLADLLSTYERLKGEGIEPVWCINHGPTVSLYYADPDGSRIELQIDVFAGIAEAKAWMAESDFAQNPIGIVFDPDQMLADFKAGVAREELVKRRPLREGETFFEHLR
jgi:catechol 2,3-dioxygenase-like lactoylglutathione lyase family enzyme